MKSDTHFRFGASADFALSRDPFSTTVEPADAFESQAFVAARDELLRELADGARLVVLIGAAGTGKTLLLRTLAVALAVAGHRVSRIDRGDLIDAAAMPEGDIVLIDEADCLSDAALIDVARAAIDPAHPAIVLALNRRRFDPLDLPIAARTVTLDKLGSSDARDFIVDRVERAGGEASLFSPGALGALTYAAGGSPRLLSLLAAGAMFQAAQAGAIQVAMGHARRAIAMQHGDAVEPPIEIGPGPAGMAPADRAPAPVAVSPRDARDLTDESVMPAAAIMPVTVPPMAAPVPIAPPLAMPVTTAELVAVEEAPAARPERRLRKRLVAAVAVVGALLVAGIVVRGAQLSDPPARQPLSMAPSAASVPVETLPATQVAEAPIVTPAPIAEPPKPAPPPAAEAPATAPPEPAPKVLVRYADGQPGGAGAAGRIADLLRARGYEVADIRAAPGRVREASTRYAGGERVAGEALNAIFETVLRAYQPGVVSRATPNADGDAARGTIEVWVPDSAAGASRPLRTDLPPG